MAPMQGSDKAYVYIKLAQSHRTMSNLKRCPVIIVLKGRIDVPSYVEHLEELKMSAIRENERKKREKECSKTYEDYDWNNLIVQEN